MKQESRTVIEHVLGRLKDIGVADVFGVPGDFAFSDHRRDLRGQEPALHRLVQRDQRGLFGRVKFHT